MARVQGEKQLHKPGKGAFYATDLEGWLHARGITHLLFAGVTTEVRPVGAPARPASAAATAAPAGSGTASVKAAAPDAYWVLVTPRAQVCVQTSMREANDRGFESLLVTDATASYFPAFKDAVIEMITAQVGQAGRGQTSGGKCWRHVPHRGRGSLMRWHTPNSGASTGDAELGASCSLP